MLANRLQNWFRNKSLVQKQVFYFLIIAFSIIAIFSTYFYYYSKAAIIGRTFDQLTAIRETKKNQVEYLLRERMTTLRVLAGNILLQEEEHKDFRPENRYVSEIDSSEVYSFPGILSYHIIYPDEHGFISGSVPADLRVVLNDSILAKLIDNSRSLHEPFLTDYLPGRKDPVLLVGIYGAKGGVPGKSPLVIFEVVASSITQALLAYSTEKGFGISGEAYLIGPDRLMRSESRFVSDAVMKVAVNSQAALASLSGNEGTTITRDYRKVKVYSSYAPLHLYGLHWAILSEIDYREAMKPIIAMRNDIIFLTVVIALFVFSVSVFLAYTIVNPVKKLEQAVSRFGQGAEDFRVESRSKDEIGVLTESFNQMAEQLSQKNAALIEERNQRLSALYNGQEKERQRIAMELHDGLGQMLAGVKLKLEHTVESSEVRDNPVMPDIRRNLSAAIDELHRISYNLRPPVVATSGLVTALKYLCDEFSKDTGIRCEISDFGDFTQLSPHTASTLYRICQEGLNNAAKHARASNVQVQTIANNQHYILILEDDGKGFCYTKPALRKGSGLFNIQERVMLLEGHLSVETAPGKGTTLRIRIPNKN